jgi:hypothetical protein
MGCCLVDCADAAGAFCCLCRQACRPSSPISHNLRVDGKGGAGSPFIAIPPAILPLLLGCVAMTVRHCWASQLACRLRHRGGTEEIDWGTLAGLGATNLVVQKEEGIHLEGAPAASGGGRVAGTGLVRKTGAEAAAVVLC